ncbi:MAG: YebC/PmpR family DNA-binding transcriptional regulator, partial [Patescibacteria group bacterium]|nr:YebC/PmpR family DNA-binding transcriptional regulator [Patescibacteria group bacterium]
MSGHSKWAQIKHQKGITDKKRGQLFSKLLNAITIAAKTDPNPQFNPRLRSAIEKAKENNVPQ